MLQQKGQIVSILSEKDVKNRLEIISSEIRYVILDENVSIDGLDKKLDSLYESYHSDIIYMNIRDNSINEGSCRKLVIYEHENLKHILLFKYNGKSNHIAILNHYFKMCNQDIEIIRDILFKEYRTVKKITFPYLCQIEKRPQMLLHEQHSDWVIELPESMDMYYNSLSTKTRGNVKSYQKRIVKDYPDFKVSFYEGEDISREQMTKLVEFNHRRMETKGKKSFNNDTECDILYQYALMKGVLCICSINDHIIGGTLNWVVGGHSYGAIISHDNAYNNYHAGYIAATVSIQYMIERNIKFYHLGFGSTEYKRSLLGKACDMKDVIVFRKRIDFHLNDILHSLRIWTKSVREKFGKQKIRELLYKWEKKRKQKK